jgi:hypothetical protein
MSPKLAHRPERFEWPTPGEFGAPKSRRPARAMSLAAVGVPMRPCRSGWGHADYTTTLIMLTMAPVGTGRT